MSSVLVTAAGLARGLCRLLAARRLRTIKLVFLDERLRLHGQGRSLGARRNSPYGAQNHQLGLALLQVLAFEKIADNRQIPEPGELARQTGHPIIHQTGDHKTLPILQLKFGLGAPCAQGRNTEARNRQTISEIEGTDLGGHLEVNVAIRHDHGSKCQLHPEIFELNGDRGETLPGLNHGEGKLAAGQKLSFLAVDRDQIRLGQDLQQVFLLERLDDRAEVDVAAKKKEVERVADANGWLVEVVAVVVVPPAVVVLAEVVET